MKKLVGLLVFLGLSVGIKTFSAPPNDEENLINLEKEWSQHSNFTQQNADFCAAARILRFDIFLPQSQSGVPQRMIEPLRLELL
jgi:hypothetical protein